MVGTAICGAMKLRNVEAPHLTHGPNIKRFLVLLMFLPVGLMVEMTSSDFLYSSVSESLNGPINSELSDLARTVINKYMAEGISCVNVISEDNLLESPVDEGEPSFIRMTYKITEEEECDSDLISKLLISFTEYCSNYVVHLSRPKCFLVLWNRANNEYSGVKHNPRILILPVLPGAVDYKEDVYSCDEADLTTDILTAEYVLSNDTGDWYIDLYTNNFNELPTERLSNGSILLDRWVPGRGFENSVDLYPMKTLNMHGKFVKVFSVEYAPYTHNDPLDGAEVRLMQTFCEASNCTFVNVTDHREWGEIYHENRTGYGCSGWVYMGEADICIGANYAWIIYWPYIDFSLGYSRGELTIVVPKPTLIGGWSSPFLPLPLSLWFAVIGSILISTTGLYLTTMGTLKYAPQLRRQLEANNKFLSWTDSFIRSVGMLVLQQPQQLVRGSPVRYLFTAMEIFCLVITTAYSAELYDYLTIPRTNKPIETVHDMADSNTIWMANDNAFTFMIRHTDDLKLHQLVENFRVRPTEEIISLAERGGYGVVIERTEGGHYVEAPFISEKIVDLSITMKESYVASSIFAYLKKGSPYTKRVNQIIGRMMNAGLYLKWEEDSAANLLDYSKQQKLLASTKKVTYPPKVLRVRDLEGAFALYFFGVSISIGFFIKELFESRRMDGSHFKRKHVKF